MKHTFYGVVLALTLGGHAYADISVPGANGSDGALNVTANTTIDLSQAPTGAWDQNNAANAGKGVYDAAKWAVVFKYSSVTIAPDTTLIFSQHPSRAPVVWLVNGNVTINGSLRVAAGPPNAYQEPGPGGFRGAGQAGFGPGGSFDNSMGPSYATLGNANPNNPAKPYGNTQIVPLIGGSAGLNGGGGGAILIAATGTITVNGTINADGANGGTGGSIRLVANRLTGSGSLSAGNSNEIGRIRLESATTIDAPLADRISPLPSIARPASPALVWPDASAPTARIVSVGAEQAPADPRGRIGPSADTLMQITTPTVPVVIETTNVPTTAVVNLRVTPYNGSATLVQATLTSGNASLARWTATITPPVGSSALQVRVEAP